MHSYIPAALIITMVIVTGCEPPPVDVSAVDVAAVEDAVRELYQQLFPGGQLADFSGEATR